MKSQGLARFMPRSPVSSATGGGGGGAWGGGQGSELTANQGVRRSE